MRYVEILIPLFLTAGCGSVEFGASQNANTGSAEKKAEAEPAPTHAALPKSESVKPEVTEPELAKVPELVKAETAVGGAVRSAQGEGKSLAAQGSGTGGTQPQPSREELPSAANHAELQSAANQGHDVPDDRTLESCGQTMVSARAAAKVAVPEGLLGLGIAMDADFLFSTKLESQNGVYRLSLWRTPRAGGDAARVADDLGGSSIELAVDDTYVYWVNARNGVQRIAKTGGEVEQLVPDDGLPEGERKQQGEQYAEAIAVGGDEVYWTVRDHVGAQGMRLMRVSKAGGAPTIVDELAGEGRHSLFRPSIAVGGSQIYFTAKPDVFATGESWIRVAKKGELGSQKLVSATGSTTLGQLLVKDGQLFWTEIGTAVKALALPNGAATELVANQCPGWGLAAGDAELYWGNAGRAGTLVRYDLGTNAPAAIGGGPELGVDHHQFTIAADASGAFWTLFPATGSGTSYVLFTTAPNAAADGM